MCFKSPDQKVAVNEPKSGHFLSATYLVFLFGPSFAPHLHCSHPSFGPHSAGPRSIFLKIRILFSLGVSDLAQLSKPECVACRVTHPIVEGNEVKG